MCTAQLPGADRDELPEAVFCLADMAGNGRWTVLPGEPRICRGVGRSRQRNAEESILTCFALCVLPLLAAAAIRCIPDTVFVKLRNRPR